MLNGSIETLDRQQKMLIHALEWALNQLNGGPDMGSKEYNAARSLIGLLKDEPYDWVYEVEMEVDASESD